MPTMLAGPTPDFVASGLETAAGSPSTPMTPELGTTPSANAGGNKAATAGQYELLYHTFSGRRTVKRPQLPPRPPSQQNVNELRIANGEPHTAQHESFQWQRNPSQGTSGVDRDLRPPLVRQKSSGARKSQSLERTPPPSHEDPQTPRQPPPQSPQKPRPNPAQPSLFSPRFGLAAVPRAGRPQQLQSRSPQHEQQSQSLAVRGAGGLRHRPSLPSMRAGRDLSEGAEKPNDSILGRPANPALRFKNMHKLVEVEQMVLGQPLINHKRVYLRDDLVEESVENGVTKVRKVFLFGDMLLFASPDKTSEASNITIPFEDLDISPGPHGHILSITTPSITHTLIFPSPALLSNWASTARAAIDTHRAVLARQSRIRTSTASGQSADWSFFRTKLSGGSERGGERTLSRKNSRSSMASRDSWSSANTVWIPDEEAPECMICRTKFTLLTRKHHCRHCGRVICYKCSRFRETNKKVRLCTGCFAEGAMYLDDGSSASTASGSQRGSMVSLWDS